MAIFRVKSPPNWLPKEPRYTYKNIPADIPIYGDLKYRGECPLEVEEARQFVRTIRARYPAYAKRVVHIPNENATRKTRAQIALDKAEGLVTGASDFLLTGGMTGAIELKRLNPTRSTWRKSQTDFLLDMKKGGGFVAYALGADNALRAFERWMEHNIKLERFLHEHGYGKKTEMVHVEKRRMSRLRDE